MLLINPEREYPRYIGDLKLEHEDWQIGDALPEGWVEVLPTEMPEYDYETESVDELVPTLVNGEYRQVWQKRDKTAEELQFLAYEAIKLKVYNRQPLTAEEAALLTE